MEFRSKTNLYGDLSALPTLYFLTPLKTGQEFTFDLERGKTLIVKLVAVGNRHEETGRRDVYFMINGEGRVVSVVDDSIKNSAVAAKAAQSRPKADAKDKSHVGAPMSGVVVECRVKPGTPVKIGDTVAVLSAMKMETMVTANMAGVIKELHVAAGESISAGDLIASIENPEKKS